MGNESNVEWQFSGNEEAQEAATKGLTVYSGRLYKMCDPDGPTILPLRVTTAETCHTAEKAVVNAVICGRGNAYAPSIGLPEAKKAVADYLNLELENKLKPEEVFMTVGCKQAIEVAVNILAKPKANVLLPSPGFPWDVVRSLYKKLEVRKYNFLPEQNYEIDFQSVRDQVDENTFAIFIINPHNPIGVTYTANHLKQIAELARELKIMVVSDEVYRWTVFGISNPFVPMAKFSSIVPVITLGSISKGWTVPGWRTGWVALHNHNGVFDSTKILDAAKHYVEIISTPGTVVQAALPTILAKTPQDFFDRRHKHLRDSAEYAYGIVKTISCLTCHQKPDACTFIWTEVHLDRFHVDDIADIQEFCDKVAVEKNLVLLPGVAFGGTNWVRHSIDMDSALLKDAFNRLVEFCQAHSKPKE